MENHNGNHGTGDVFRYKKGHILRAGVQNLMMQYHPVLSQNSQDIFTENPSIVPNAADSNADTGSVELQNEMRKNSSDELEDEYHERLENTRRAAASSEARRRKKYLKKKETKKRRLDRIKAKHGSSQRIMEETPIIPIPQECEYVSNCLIVDNPIIIISGPNLQEMFGIDFHTLISDQ